MKHITPLSPLFSIVEGLVKTGVCCWQGHRAFVIFFNRQSAIGAGYGVPRSWLTSRVGLVVELTAHEAFGTNATGIHGRPRKDRTNQQPVPRIVAYSYIESVVAFEA